ncbi:hypothetical protein EV132_101182 [Rhizobium sullae]|uniref:Uncharacterized protein n=1 Tax=Rhizobium sullae TaxID=50338 RepID=A0A4R3QEN2_RHISU|nr:hypothetical protein EV132_101182 [Rhizobium sullae]
MVVNKGHTSNKCPFEAPKPNSNIQINKYIKLHCGHFKPLAVLEGRNARYALG